jgi:hypothetical protein
MKSGLIIFVAYGRMGLIRGVVFGGKGPYKRVSLCWEGAL